MGNGLLNLLFFIVAPAALILLVVAYRLLAVQIKRARVSPTSESETPPPPEFTLCREICEAVAAADAERDATEATDRLAARFAKDDGVAGVEAVDGAAEASSLGLRKLCGADRGVTAASFAEDRGHAAAELAHFREHKEARSYTWARANVGDVGDLKLRAAVRRRDARELYHLQAHGCTRAAYYIGNERAALVDALVRAGAATHVSLCDAGADVVVATAVAYLRGSLLSSVPEAPSTDPWGSLRYMLDRLDEPLLRESAWEGMDI